MSDERIVDIEVVFRRIPPGSSWFEPPNRITSANFKLRKGEAGISVYRKNIVDAANVLAKREAAPGSKIAQATVGEIRALKSADNRPLNLDVLPVNDEEDPGHSEIRGPNISQSVSKALQRLFKIV